MKEIRINSNIIDKCELPILSNQRTYYDTSKEAIEKYGITRLSDRIFQLRNSGVKILTTMIAVSTRYGKEEVAKYILIKEKSHQ